MISGSSYHEISKYLLIEDDEADFLLFNEHIISSEYGLIAVKRVTSIDEAERVLDSHIFDLIILDIYLPDSDNLEGLQLLLDKYPQTPIVVMTGKYDPDVAMEAMNMGAQDVIEKHRFEKNELRRRLVHAKIRGDLRRQREEIRREGH